MVAQFSPRRNEEKRKTPRPGTGIDPRHLDLVVGRIARVDIPEDTTLTWEMV